MLSCNTADRQSADASRPTANGDLDSIRTRLAAATRVNDLKKSRRTLGDHLDAIGYYIMIALLGAGVAYGLANKGKPKPALSTTKKKIVTACAVVVVGCLVLGAAVALIAQSHPTH